MFMLNECHFHLCDCTCLNVFSHAQSLLNKHKKIFECFSCFWKVFCYRDFSQLTSDSLASKCFSRKKDSEYFSKIWVFMLFAAKVGNLFASGRSNRKGYTEIFTVQIATLSQVEVLVAKNT